MKTSFAHHVSINAGGSRFVLFFAACASFVQDLDERNYTDVMDGYNVDTVNNRKVHLPSRSIHPLNRLYEANSRGEDASNAVAIRHSTGPHSKSSDG